MIVNAIASALFGVVLWNVLRWPRVKRGSDPRGSLAILIPARDEEDNLPGCFKSVLPQCASEILVYDDHSVDRTSTIVDEFAALDARVRRIVPLALPAGWTGKNFACSQLAAHAGSEWLLFLDADARLAPFAAASIVSEAERRQLSLLSCWPRFEMRSFWEAILMPMLNFVVFTLFPAPLAGMRDDASLGLAHGACILARRDVYQRLGGHSLVRAEIFEDTRLAQNWRALGERSLCLDGQDFVRVRMYSGFGAIWKGFQKNFYPAFRLKGNFWLFLGLHGVVFLLPFMIVNRSAILLVLGIRALLAARFRQPWLGVPLHPVGEVVLLALGLCSWWNFRMGSGVAWKGRLLDIPASSRFRPHEAG